MSETAALPPAKRRFSFTWCLGVALFHFAVTFALLCYYAYASTSAFVDDGAGKRLWHTVLWIWSPPSGAHPMSGYDFNHKKALLLGLAAAFSVFIGIVAGGLAPIIGRRLRSRSSAGGALPFLPSTTEKTRRLAAPTIILLEVIWIGWMYYSTFLAEVSAPFLTMPDRFKFRSWASDIRHAPTFNLYEGLPHPFDEGELLAREKATKKTLEVFGWSAYAQPFQVTPEDAAALHRLATSASSYKTWTGPKLCGGFHPDYFLAWKDGTDTHYLLLCFGCHEMVFYNPKRAFLVEIREGALEEFRTVLVKYRKQRPMNSRPGGTEEESIPRP